MAHLRAGLWVQASVSDFYLTNILYSDKIYQHGQGFGRGSRLESWKQSQQTQSQSSSHEGKGGSTRSPAGGCVQERELRDIQKEPRGGLWWVQRKQRLIPEQGRVQKLHGYESKGNKSRNQWRNARTNFHWNGHRLKRKYWRSRIHWFAVQSF